MISIGKKARGILFFFSMLLLMGGCAALGHGREKTDEDQQKYLFSCLSILAMQENKVRVYVKPYGGLQPSGDIRDIKAGHKFIRRERHSSYDYIVKAIHADGIVVDYQGYRQGGSAKGTVKLKWKPPLSASLQSQQDQSQRNYLNTCFLSIEKKQNKGRIVVKRMRGMAPAGRAVDVQGGSRFFRREKYSYYDYIVKVIHADGIVFKYIGFGEGNDAIGSVKLKWKR